MNNRSTRSRRKILLFILGLIGLVIVAVVFLTQRFADEDQSRIATPESPSPTVVITLPPTGTYIEDQLIVKFKPGQAPDELSDPAKLQEIRKADTEAGMIQRTKLFAQNTGELGQYYAIVLKQGSDLRKAMQIYQALPEVAEVQTNGIVEAQ